MESEKTSAFQPGGRPAKAKSLQMETIGRLIRHRSVVLGTLILMVLMFGSLLAPWIAPHDPYQRDGRVQLQPPSRDHWFGTDGQGRDIFTRVLYGGRVSLVVGVIATGVGAIGGITMGMLAGYFGGRTDDVIGRLVDILLAFPGILLALLIILILGPGMVNVMIAIGISRIPQFARLVRGSVLSAKESDYVVAAKAAGAGPLMIMLRHLLPNIFAPILVYATLSVGTAIISAAGLSYLGLGAQPPTPEWGLMLSRGRDFMAAAYWMTTFPGAAILVAVIAMNVLGDGLRDVLDPRMRGSA